MAKAPKVQKTNAMRELEREGVPYILHTYEDDGEEAVVWVSLSPRSWERIPDRDSRRS